MIDKKLMHALFLRETDVNGALRRLYGDEELYKLCLLQFLSDPTLSELRTSIETKAWDDAFTAAHALKGLAGNMGFVPLMHATGSLVVVLRAGRLGDIPESLAQVESSYRDITDAIQSSFTNDEAEAKENHHVK